MKLEAEKREPIDNPAEDDIITTLKNLRSYGPSSFASITDDKGNYIQVAGVGTSCILERRFVKSGEHLRAYQDKRSKIFPDGTILAFSGGDVRLAADEWFTIQVVTDAFCAFLKEEYLPVCIKWRDITAMFK